MKGFRRMLRRVLGFLSWGQTREEREFDAEMEAGEARRQTILKLGGVERRLGSRGARAGRSSCWRICGLLFRGYTTQARRVSRPASLPLARIVRAIAIRANVAYIQ